jgi:prophage antirepressor-like protein
MRRTKYNTNNDIIPFDYYGNEVRTIMINDEPWWVAKDVCEVLGIRTNDAMNSLDEDEKGYETIVSPGGPQEMAIINEPGLYSLILRSRKPEAKQFKRWVTHEVLPTIRKKGYYVAPDAEKVNPNVLNDLVVEFKKLQNKIEEWKPHVNFSMRMRYVKNSQSMGATAKTLKIGRNVLFQILRDEGVLMHSGDQWNLPYQRYIDSGDFVVVQTSPKIRTTRVTNKGMQLISGILDEIEERPKVIRTKAPKDKYADVEYHDPDFDLIRLQHKGEA